jgi:hypothetical protein
MPEETDGARFIFQLGKMLGRGSSDMRVGELDMTAGDGLRS